MKKVLMDAPEQGILIMDVQDGEATPKTRKVSGYLFTNIGATAPFMQLLGQVQMYVDLYRSLARATYQYHQTMAELDMVNKERSKALEMEKEDLLPDLTKQLSALKAVFPPSTVVLDDLRNSITGTIIRETGRTSPLKDGNPYFTRSPFDQDVRESIAEANTEEVMEIAKVIQEEFAEEVTIENIRETEELEEVSYIEEKMDRAIGLIPDLPIPSYFAVNKFLVNKLAANNDEAANALEDFIAVFVPAFADMTEHTDKALNDYLS